LCGGWVGVGSLGGDDDEAGFGQGFEAHVAAAFGPFVGVPPQGRATGATTHAGGDLASPLQGGRRGKPTVTCADLPRRECWRSSLLVTHRNTWLCFLFRVLQGPDSGWQPFDVELLADLPQLGGGHVALDPDRQ
jgi:hypothetical protein